MLKINNIMKRKRLKEGQEMPLDFWNYKVNPIVGYDVPPVFSVQSCQVFLMNCTKD